METPSFQTCVIQAAFQPNILPNLRHVQGINWYGYLEPKSGRMMDVFTFNITFNSCDIWKRVPLGGFQTSQAGVLAIGAILKMSQELKIMLNTSRRNMCHVTVPICYSCWHPCGHPCGHAQHTLCCNIFWLEVLSTIASFLKR